MNFKTIAIQILTCCLLQSGSLALAKTARVFKDDTVLSATLTFDISAYQKDKESLRETGLPAVLHLEGEESLNIEVLSRGAGSMHNDMPPFKLKFKKKTAKKTVFKGLKKVKVITPAELLDEKSDQFILSQYLIYRLYELYSPMAYKTRLVRIHLKDSSGKNEYEPRLMILLEPNRNLGKRLKVAYTPFKGEKGQDVENLKDSLDLSYSYRVIAFNFFIRNPDAAVPGLESTMAEAYGFEGFFPFEKNIKIFKDIFELSRPVPYDFDLSGASDVFGVCMWQVVHLILVVDHESTDAEAESTQTAPSLVCQKETIEETLSQHFEMHLHKDKLLQHRERYLKAVRKWKEVYEETIKKLSPAYMQNFDMHLEALKKLK